MTTQEQADAVAAYWATKIALYGANTSLTNEQQTENTDGCAAILDDVNPDHKYPPVNK